MLIYDFNAKKIQIKDAEMVAFLSDIYDESRYLRNASEEGIYLRLNGLIASLVTFDPMGAPQFHVRNGIEAIALVELRQELKLRNMDIDEIFTSRLSTYCGLFTQNDIERIQSQLNKYHGRKCLFKFTKAKYIDSILRGEIRFQQASSYNDPNLSVAIQDDELSIEHNIPGLYITTPRGEVIPVKDGRITAAAAGDYYVSCFSASFKLQYFNLFECDSCVVIPEADQFSDTVLVEYIKKYTDSWIIFNRVKYVDRYRQLKTKSPIELRKSWDYSYENEYRFVSWPKNPEQLLTPTRLVNIDPRDFDCCSIHAPARQLA